MSNQSESVVQDRAARSDAGRFRFSRETQFHAAQERIAELEAEVHLYREKSAHAEEWLRKISMEIEDRLVNEPEERATANVGTRLNHEIELRSMTEDGNRPATLHNGAVSTDFPTLQDAIMAWHRLRPEQARTASIRIIGGRLSRSG